MLYVKLGQFMAEVLTLFFIKVMARTAIKVKLYLLQLTGKEMEVKGLEINGFWVAQQCS